MLKKLKEGGPPLLMNGIKLVFVKMDTQRLGLTS